jgi:hypothetical protein
MKIATMAKAAAMAEVSGRTWAGMVISVACAPASFQVPLSVLNP